MENVYRKDKGLLENVKKSLFKNIPFNLFLVLAVIIIGMFNNDVKKALYTIVLFYFWAYFIHVIAHYIPPFTYAHGFHHNPDQGHTWWGVTIETIVNILGCGGISLAILGMIIQKLYGYHLFDYHVLFFTTIMYTTFHMVNYHVLDIETHNNHHRNSKTNFGPDIMDVLFGTKMENDEYENMNHAVYNIVFTLAFIIFTFNTKFDLVKSIKGFIDRVL